jgi:hypothetical protein
MALRSRLLKATESRAAGGTSIIKAESSQITYEDE